MDTREVLLKAADLVEERGLAKFTQEDKSGAVCVQGAIQIALYGRPFSNDWSPEATAANVVFGKYVKANGPDPERALDNGSGNAHWNNMPTRTKEEVVAALRGAADSVVSAGTPLQS